MRPQPPIPPQTPFHPPNHFNPPRHWHNAGYLVQYISARPDMQHRKVVKWLAKHNFPRGFLWFADGLSSEPLVQKAAHLRRLVREVGGGWLF